jgi:hypothetical protein
MTELPQAHSPLGASSAERWMTCPASVSLSTGHQDEESDHAALGTAAHALAAYCLSSQTEAWTTTGTRIIGERFYPPGGKTPIPEGGHLVDKGMADAVSEYVAFIDAQFPDRNQGNSWVERKFHCPSIHKLFYGTSDFTAIVGRKATVVDYKHGAGIVVDAVENPQLMYYAAGVLEDLNAWDDVDEIELVIVQPRAFHYDGPIRSWTIRTADLVTWLEDKLVPAMDLALVSRDTKSGEHCRFCPARFGACPQIMSDVDEMEELMNIIGKDGQGAPKLTGEQLARFLDLGEVFKIARTAALKTATIRVQNGHKVPGWKLSKARSNRQFKEGAEAAAKKEFGDDAYSKPELKSPADIDKMPKGKDFTARWAFKPDAGETLVPEDDARPAVNKDVKSMFKPIKKSK